MTEETRTLDCRVSESGFISLPVVGVVKVANKSVQEIQKAIEEALSKLEMFQNPRVGVSVKDYRSRRIAVIGAVNAPGVYAIHENVSTLMDMLTLAGGPADNSGQIIYVLRREKGESQPVRIVVDIQELFDRGNFDLNAVLQGDDIVYVPRAPLFYVYGAVRSPGGFSLRRSIRALEALALAGGLLENADKKDCFLVRRAQAGGEQIVRLNVARIECGKDPDLFLREGDVLRVPESLGKNILTELWGVVRGIFTFTYRLNE
jgi:polysaccharide export outer membrane protein